MGFNSKPLPCVGLEREAPGKSPETRALADCRRDITERIRVRDIVSRVSEVGMIERIQCLSPDLKIDALSK